MQLELELLQAAQLIAELPNYQPGYTVLYWGEWSTYEEYGWLAILQRDGVLYELRGGHCVMGPLERDQFDPTVTTQEAALEAMLDMEQAASNMENRNG